MEKHRRTKLTLTVVGLLFVGTGTRIIQNISGAGGDLVPPIFGFGGLLVLFGLWVVVAAWQHEAEWRQLLKHGIVAGSVGFFALSSYVAMLSYQDLDSVAQWGGGLASFFFMLGVVGMGLSGLFVVLVLGNRR